MADLIAPDPIGDEVVPRHGGKAYWAGFGRGANPFRWFSADRRRWRREWKAEARRDDPWEQCMWLNIPQFGDDR